MNNNDYRRKQFEKRRSYKGTISMCEGYDCPIFSNCLLEIKQLQQENKKLKDNWNKLKKWVKSNIKVLEEQEKGWDKLGIAEVNVKSNIKIFFKMLSDITQEIEGNDSNEEKN